MPAPVDVSGGTGGIAAQCDTLRDLAGCLGAAAQELAGAALALHALLFDPAITAAGVASAKEVLCFEIDLGDALDGPTGLTWVAAEFAAADLEVRAAAAAYETLDGALARLIGLATGAVRLPAALLAAGSRALRGDPVVAVQTVITTDPELADLLVVTLGLPAHIARLSAALPDGRPVVTSGGVDRVGPAGRPPRGLADVVRGLAQRNQGPHGAIDVRILTDATGRRRVLVDITGTKTAALLPTEDVTGLLTDGKALVGRSTTYEEGVFEAMRRAGVTRDDEVMLVGHSEGGMVAVTAARDAVRSGRFNVTRVLTAGSPVGLTTGALPRSVQVLALENRRDVVPHLDGAANPDRRNVTTVTGTAGNGTLIDDHSLEDGYVPIAADTEASDSRSVRDFLRGSSGWFTAASVTTLTYVITRDL